MLTPEQVIEARKSIGLPVPGSTSNVDDIIARAKQKLSPPESRFQDVGQDIVQTGQNLAGTFNRTQQKMQDITQAEKSGQNVVRSFGQRVGALAGGISGAIGDVVTGGIKAVLKPKEEEQAKKALATAITPIIQSKPVEAGMAAYERLKTENPALARDLEGIIGVGSLALDLAGVGAGKKVATEAVETGVRQAGKLATATGEAAVKTGSEVKNTIVRSLAVDADENIKTILQRTPTEKFDEAVKVAEEATKNPEAITLFEKAGDAMEEATKQLDSQRKSLIQEKQKLLNKASTGLVPFKDPTRRAILEIRKLGDSEEVKRAITVLKGVKNKVDADKAIDTIQDMIYSGNRTQVIPQGSTLDKRMRGVIGKYNDELKNSLPAAYRNLNVKASNRIKAIQTLNSALGEVVDGVATRGASLIKQFFSPSGRKAKELFDYIKKNTGVDLAQDATLAKYMMEIFDDPRARSLLQGIPRSKSGVIDTAIDFVVEKTGVGKGVRDTIRKQTIEKARDITR